jgi:tRNA threonylcarbamoyladenosine biosynthesis protein TsaB
MLTLAIDSATEACSVALFDDGQLIAGDYRILGRGHAELLVPMIAGLPDKGRAERIVVALGPGSFTGIRVGLAAARALAFAWGSELLGYSTLALVAAMARDQRGDQALAVVSTGGHGEWFTARFDAMGAPTSPAATLQPDAAASLLDEALVAGSQAEALVSQRGHGEALPLLPDARCVNLLTAVAFTQDVLPHYGRPPDAKLPATAP